MIQTRWIDFFGLKQAGRRVSAWAVRCMSNFMVWILVESFYPVDFPRESHRHVELAGMDFFFIGGMWYAVYHRHRANRKQCLLNIQTKGHNNDNIAVHHFRFGDSKRLWWNFSVMERASPGDGLFVRSPYGVSPYGVSSYNVSSYNVLYRRCAPVQKFFPANLPEKTFAENARDARPDTHVSFSSLAMFFFDFCFFLAGVLNVITSAGP